MTSSGPHVVRRECGAQVIPNYKLKHDTAWCTRVQVRTPAEITRRWNWISIAAAPIRYRLVASDGRFFGMTLLLLAARAWFAQSNNGIFNSTDYSERPADASLIASLRARRSTRCGTDDIIESGVAYFNDSTIFAINV